MPLYEHVFLARQDLSQAQVDALGRHRHRNRRSRPGQGRQDRDLGPQEPRLTRSTATARPTSCCSTSSAPGTVVAELERQTRINEDVIRYLTVRVDEHEEGPSAMMRKKRARP